MSILRLSEFDQKEPPTDDEGEFVCGRRCKDGTRCVIRVPVGYTTCQHHEISDPIILERTKPMRE